MRITDKELKNAHSGTDRSIMDELRDLDDDGVEAVFSVVPGARVRCEGCHQTAHARTYALLDVRRLEGKSDPSEMAAVLSLRCANCSVDGACIVSFGPMASAEDQDVMLALGADERLPSRSTPTAAR